jgi:hypothetical protein
MLPRIREILLTQYIGAIVTALLILDAISQLIQLTAHAISWGILNGGAEHSAFARRPSPAEILIPTAIRSALYVTVAYTFVRWLYLQKQVAAVDDNPAAGDANDPPSESL